MIFIQKLWHHKNRIILLGGCAGVLAVAALFFLGIYPLALVNGHVITERQFRSASAVASFYYNTALKTYTQGKEDLKSINQTDLESAILMGLIENELVREKLGADLGKEVPYLVGEKLASVGDSSNFKNAAATLYGLTWDDFKREVLTPQAKRNLLSEHLFLKKEKVEDWLLDAKKKARVTIFSSKFTWDGSNVAARK